MKAKCGLLLTLINFGLPLHAEDGWNEIETGRTPVYARASAMGFGASGELRVMLRAPIPNYEWWDGSPYPKWKSAWLWTPDRLLDCGELGRGEDRFLSGSNLLATSSNDHIAIWRIPEGRELVAFEIPSQHFCHEFSPNGKWLATGHFDSLVRIWDVSSGALKRTLRGVEQYVYCLAFSADSKKVAAGDPHGNLLLWSLETGELLRKFEGHAEQLSDISISPDGKHLASTSFDETTRVWNLATAKQKFAIPGWRLCLEFSPNGKQLVVGKGAWSNAPAEIWDVFAERRLAELNTPIGSVWKTVCFSPDGKSLASDGSHRGALLFTFEAGRWEQTELTLGHP